MQLSQTLSIDAMGGDNAPRIVVDGAAEFLLSRPGMHVLLHGDEATGFSALAPDRGAAQSQTAPREADPTSRTYLPSTPRS